MAGVPWVPMTIGVRIPPCKTSNTTGHVDTLIWDTDIDGSGGEVGEGWVEAGCASERLGDNFIATRIQGEHSFTRKTNEIALMQYPP